MVTVVHAPEQHQVQPGEGYDGVVQVVAGRNSGSGVLLHGGRAVLTAAHLLDGASSVSVQLGTPEGYVSLSTAFYTLHPAYDATQSNSDLALVWLDTPAPASVQRSTVYRQQDELGQVISLVGYGLTGDGVRGYVPQESTGPAKHLAINRIDTTGEALKAALGSSIAWDPTPGSQLIIDFDNGSPSHDALGILMGLQDLGLGASEGMIAPGDSGGPAFIGDKVAGIATYTASLSRAGQSPDVNLELDSSFGEIAGFQRVSHYQQWIDQSLRTADPNAPTRPEEVQHAIVEGDSGTQPAYFLLEFHGIRDHPNQWLSVDYATRDGTAIAGEDYLPMADTLILYPGETQATIAVEVIGNKIPEPDETFYLDVFNPVGGSFGEGVVQLTAMRTIINDDGWIA